MDAKKMQEVFKVCKKHGELIKKQCYFYKTKIGNVYPRCLICMKEATARLKEEGYFRSYNKTENGRLSKNKYHEKVKNTSEFKEKRKKYLPKVREWYKKRCLTEEYRSKKNKYELKRYYKDIDKARNKNVVKERKHRDIISDRYMRKLLTMRNLNSFLIYPEIINFYKVLLLIKREIRKQKE